MGTNTCGKQGGTNGQLHKVPILIYEAADVSGDRHNIPITYLRNEQGGGDYIDGSHVSRVVVEYF